MLANRARLERLATRAEAKSDIRASLSCSESIARLDEALLRREEATRPPGSRPVDKEANIRTILELTAKALARGVDYEDTSERLLLARRIAENPEFRETVRSVVVDLSVASRAVGRSNRRPRLRKPSAPDRLRRKGEDRTPGCARCLPSPAGQRDAKHPASNESLISHEPNLADNKRFPASTLDSRSPSVRKDSLRSRVRNKHQY